MEEFSRERQEKEKRIFKSPTEIIRELKKRIESFIPDDFSQHMINSKKEKLLALRALIDHAIDGIEQRQQELHNKKSKGQNR